MENIIKKAIQGGYEQPDILINGRITIEDGKLVGGLYPGAFCVMDPLFWQALGKALKWKDWLCEECWSPQYEKGATYCTRCKYLKTFRPEWLLKAVAFHELNLTEGFDKAVSWLEDQIK